MPDDRPLSPEERLNPNVHLCDGCNENCGGGIVDEIDHGCSVCGSENASHVYVPALSTPAGPSPEWCATCEGDGMVSKPEGNVICSDCNGTQVAAPSPREEACAVNPFSSAACERGTKGCEVVHPSREEAVEAAAKALDAARQVTALLSGHPGQWTLDGYGITDDAASELLSLHDFLNDVDRLSAARPSSPTPERLTDEQIKRLWDLFVSDDVIEEAAIEYTWAPGRTVCITRPMARGVIAHALAAALRAFHSAPGDDATTKEGR